MNPDTTYYSSKSPIIIPMGATPRRGSSTATAPAARRASSAATTISDNVVFAQLSVDVGPENTVAVAHKMGITSPLDAVPSITLGTSGVTPLEMADAYATLASGGIHHTPQAIVKVVLPNGRVDWKPKTKGKRAIPAGVASVVTQCLERVAPRRHRLAHRRLLPLPARRQDRHHRERLGRLVLRLHAAARGRRVDGRRREELAHGRRLRRHLLRADVGQVLRRGAQGPGHTRASRIVPWTFSPWHGEMQGMSPSASPSPVRAARSPTPGPTKTIKPTPTPTPTTPKPTPTTPKPTPTTPKPTADGRRPGGGVGEGGAPMAAASAAGDGSRGLAGAAAAGSPASSASRLRAHQLS